MSDANKPPLHGSPAGAGFVPRYFEFVAEGTSYRREIVGGITTFLAMSYILFVNPQILGTTGMDKGALFTATALATIVGCLLMALIARYPVAVAPSMGENAFFAYTVVIGLGLSWQTALVGSLIAGVLFVIVTAFRLREMILDAIPADLKLATACGIGLFIAFIGLQSSGIIVADKATLVTLGPLTRPGALLTIFGLFFTVAAMLRRVPGAILFGMIATSILGVVTGIIQPPHGVVSRPPSLDPVFGVALTHMVREPAAVFVPKLVVVVLTFLFVLFFDTAGTLIGVAQQAGLMDGNRLRREGRALLSDSLSVVAASLVGSSPTGAYIESTTGVAAGARTGFAAIVVAILVALAMLFSPLLAVVTADVTAPALIIVGVLMASPLAKIDWEKLEHAVPAFLTIVMMPLTYSIATGVAVGLVAYPAAMVFKGRWREVHPMMYALLVICVLYFAFLAA